MVTLVALCAVGAEKILANEIKKLEYSPVENAPGRVVFTAKDTDAMYRANLCLRTADRVYLLLGDFDAPDFDSLFEGVKSIPWQDYFNKDVRLVVDKVRSHKSRLSSEHSIQAMVQKAIYTKLGNVWHMSTMPETGSTATVRVYLEKDRMSVMLDLSGLPLNRRGYRTMGGEAPIRETLAAVLLHQMCWRRKTPIHDPFCGSGTIAIEAALYAYNVAPGLGRSFALENLSIYNAGRMLEIKKQEAEKIRPDCLARITGSDISEEAVNRARLNAEHACVMAGRALQLIGSDARIQRPDFVTASFDSLAAPYENGLLLANPPYGERLGTSSEAEDLYREMSVLFENFPGWQMGFITANSSFENCIGKKAAKTKSLKSGNLDTIFYMFQ